MSTWEWIAAAVAVAVIAVLAVWAAADAARACRQRPSIPVREVLALVVAIAWMLVLAFVFVLLRAAHAGIGWLGARVERRLRRLGADGDTIVDDHGHPWDPENNDWQDPWSPA